MTRCLLDTHILLWMLGAPENLRPEHRKILEAGLQSFYVSMVSLWEIKIKENRGRLKIRGDMMQDLRRLGIKILPLYWRHLQRLDALPFYAEHRDPFDRLLIAQAQDESMALMTTDAAFQRYALVLS